MENRPQLHLGDTIFLRYHVCLSCSPSTVSTWWQFLSASWSCGFSLTCCAHFSFIVCVVWFTSTGFRGSGKSKALIAVVCLLDLRSLLPPLPHRSGRSSCPSQWCMCNSRCVLASLPRPLTACGMYVSPLTHRQVSMSAADAIVIINYHSFIA
jgi:hypothetical protein